jgi:pyridoxine kinase
MRTDCSPRLFKIDVPAIDCFFSGTGDMFAALTLVRLREAITGNNLASTKSWVSPDDVEAVDLPLAKAAEKVLGSIQAVLEKTKKARDEVLGGMSGPMRDMQKDSEKRSHLRKTKAAEVMIVRNQDDLRDPHVLYRAEPLSSGDAVSKETRHNSSDFKDQ